MVHFKLEQFSGPLDLLLGLLQDQKLDITTIALSEVTEQYLMYIEEIEETAAEDIADFLVIATRLLLLKSQTLLPQFSLEEEPEGDLSAQLRLYKAFVDASKHINTLWLEDKRSAFRTEPKRFSVDVIPPQNMTLDLLKQSMIQLVNRLKPLKALPQARIDKAVSLKEKIAKIQAIIKKIKKFNFFEIIEESQNKTDVIVSFLAILELVKQKEIFLKQEDTFADIMIERV